MADWERRWREIIRLLARVQSPRGEGQLLDWLAQPREPTVLAFVNAHAMNSAVDSRAFFDAVSSADVVLRDGIGMAILLDLFNQAPGLNLNGTDLIPKILRHFDGATLALFGTQEPYLSKARQNVLSQLAPRSRCVLAHGFHATEAYVRAASLHRPRVIVLGMGMPRQEEVAVALRAAVGYPCLIICGGAIIDFLGHKTTRAPAWLRRSGLEWAWRLALEPRRLFRRYVVGNPLFVARAVWLAMRSLLKDVRYSA